MGGSLCREPLFCAVTNYGLIYNKGKSIAYVWDKEKFSDKEARKN